MLNDPSRVSILLELTVDIRKTKDRKYRKDIAMNNRSPLRFAIRVLIFFALCSSPFAIFAQTSTANLSGTVTDANGAVVPGVTVTVTDLATRLQRTATTNDAGQFVVPLLPASKYSVMLQRDGFMTAEVNEVIVNVNDAKSLNIRLKTMFDVSSPRT